MAKQIPKRTLALLLALAVFCSLAIPFVSIALDWWIMETAYTVTGREPITEAGPKSRIFLPEMTAATADDGIEMDMIYEVQKDGEVFAGGDYTKGLYVDLDGAGTYLFILKGVDALNDYTFTVVAKEENPSLIHEAVLPLAVKQTDAFHVPAAKLAFGEETVDAQIRLRMASGSVYQYEEKALAESGLMQVEYYAQLGGQEQCVSFPVNVLPGGIGFYDESGNFYAPGTKVFDNYALTGALLDGAMGRTFTFSQVLDLSQMTTEVPLVVLGNGSMNSTIPFFRIVDAHDASNYLEIMGRVSMDNADMVYTVANAPGQSKVGHLGGTNLYTQTVFGTETRFAARDQADRDVVGKFYYDAAEKAIYADWYGRVSLIADFDADYNMRPWKGFSTGEVYLQVLRRNENDFVCVESVCGMTMDGNSSDALPPAISVDVDEANVPFALVGKPFPLFDAKAVDVMDTGVELDMHIYKGADAASGVEVNIQDGTFVPYGPGYYTIVYSAMDCNGNKAEKRINVLAYQEADAPVMNAQITGIPTEALAGARITLPAAENITGGSGETGYTVRLKAADGTVTEQTGAYAVMPGAGVNTIEYVLTDYLGRQQVLAFPVSCSLSATPVLYDLDMPKYIQSGTKLTLPAAEYAQDASVTTYITATLDGAELAVDGNVIVPETTQAKAELVVTYHAKNAGGETTKRYTMEVFGCDIADRTSYFYTEKGSLTKTQEMNSIRLDTAESGSSFRFVSSVLADKFNLVMSVDPEKNNSDRLVITLTDAVYPDVCVQMEIVKKDDGDSAGRSQFFVNGVQGNDMVGNFYGSVESLSLSYQKNSKAIVDAQGNSLAKITHDLSGKVFNGFPSNQVYITVSAGQVSGDFSFHVMQINNQNFAEDSMFFDNYPEIAVSGTLTLQCKIGDEVVAPAAYSVDVLSPNVDLSLTVRKGTSPILTDQPVDQDYKVKLDQYGKYYIVYNYSVGDFSRSVTYPVQTVEYTPPQVQMPSVPTEAAVGSKVTLTLPTVTDESSMNTTVSILVQDPEFTVRKVDLDSLQFEVETAGKYVIYYYVYDECSNYQLLRYELIVK